MEFEKLLRLMVEKGGSDLFITAGVPPSMKVNGKIMPVTKNAMSPEQTRETVHSVMNEQQRRDFTENHECNFAISARGIGRFRVSAFYQRNLVGMVLRRIETNIPTTEDLKLPEIVKKLAMTKRGLVLFVGENVLSALGRSGMVPVPLAAWAPAFIALAIGVSALLHLEDG